MQFKKTLSLLKYLFLASIFFLTSCSKNEQNSDDTNPNPNPPTPNPVTPLDKSRLKGWWSSYKNGTLNTPVPNPGYPLIYLGNDSFYLQKFLGNFMPGEWVLNNDSILIDNAFRSKVTLTGDTLLKLSSGIYNQYYIKKDSALIVNNSPRIITIAGTGTVTFNGDNIAAITANINSPSGVAVDNAGNIFITEPNQNRIRKIAASNGIISIIAGTGTPGFGGDGGPAVLATLDYPTSIATDVSGNVYFSDAYNKRIRKISSVTGTITTVAGTGNVGYSGDGGPATSAQIRIPGGLAVDNTGNIYFADSYNHCIRKISSAGGIISTIAGTGVAGYSGDNGPSLAAQLNQPAGLALDNTGNILIADNLNHCVRKIILSTNQIITVAGTGVAGFNGDNGPAVSAWYYQPEGIACDNAGNILIADTKNNRIRRISVSDGTINTIAGNGNVGFNGDGVYATFFSMNVPVALAKDNTGNILIADKNNNRIRKLINR
ncbi:MAG: NHL repeat-containing protein [Bacteroidota bacterium]